MAGTTYRGEIERDGRLVNARAVLPLNTTLSGTNPRNPIQLGLGMTFTVVGNAQVASVTGTLRHLANDAEEEGRSITFSKSASAFIWTAEGAAGGSALGFPQSLDYDTPQPFEMEISVVYRGGRQSRRYGFWVGNGEVSGCANCYTRESFSAVLQNCCFNQRGFRANGETIPSSGSPGPDLLEFGEYDAFFDPTLYPGWAVGLSISGLDTVCSPDRDLLNPYLPDSVTGESNGNADDPFSVPSSPLVDRTRTEQLDVFQLRERLDDTAGGTGVINGDINPGADAQGNPYMDPPGFNRSAPFYIGPGPKPLVRGTSLIERAKVEALWDDGSTEASLAATSAIRLTLTGFQNGDSVFLFASSDLATFAGPLPFPGNPNPPVVAAPLGVTSTAPKPHLIEPRMTLGASGTGMVNHYLNLGLAPTIYTITAGLTWGTTSIGARYVLLPSDFVTPVVITVPVDQTVLGAILTAIAAVQHAPEGAGVLFLQGIVCRPGTQPVPDTTGVSTFNALWPHDAFLTNIVALRFRA